MLNLAEIFQNHMTLQRNKPVQIWGYSECIQHIKVYINETLVSEHDISKGNFEIKIPPQKELESSTVKIESDRGKIICLEDVDFGEVWIAGGQSNMEFALCCDKEAEQILSTASDPHLRFYDVGEYAFEGEKEEGIKDGSHWDRWMKFEREDSGWFSAVGAYFALYIKLTLDVPVAIVGCNWGGTSASTWIKESILRNDSQLRIYTDTYDAFSKKQNRKVYIIYEKYMRKKQFSRKATENSIRMLKYENTKPTTLGEKIKISIIQKLSVTGSHDPNRPAGLYEMMLSKIKGYTCQGVIWYQGESDEHYADIYARLFSKMIQCWRKDWKDKLPFYFVQLAPWEEWLGMNGKNYPVIRQQQQIVEDSVEKTGMVSIMDLGCRYDIHPKEKRPVGERLSRLALQETYGIAQKYCHSPRIKRVKRIGNQITAEFEFAEGGLCLKGNVKNLFEIRKNGKKLLFDVRVEGENIILVCNDLKSDEKITFSFAYKDYLVMTIFNKGDLPARPFAPIEL